MSLYKLKKAAVTAINTGKSVSLSDKIVVFESDDWGSIRTPSLEAAEEVKKLSAYTSEPAYLEVDTLENEPDLTNLFELLSLYKDYKGNHPTITANFVMANPLFEEIKASSFSTYYYEPFPETYQRYFGSNRILETVKEGMASGLFYPQFHGREHVNIPLWLEVLKDKDPAFLKAFDYQFFGIQTAALENQKRNVQVSFELDSSSPYLEPCITEGLKLFETIFGYPSASFIPNNYVWDQQNNHLLKALGVKYLQGVRIQSSPIYQGTRLQKKRFAGTLEEGLISIVRNGIFEPSFRRITKEETLKRCLDEIEVAFLFNQPAVISTHRLNFVSGLSVKNRDENLQIFEHLIKKILKKWPSVQFMNTEQLGKLYQTLS